MERQEVAPDEVARAVRRGLARVGWTASTAGAAVTFAAVAVLIPVVVSPGDQLRLGLINGPLVVLSTLAGRLAMTTIFSQRVGRALAWMAEGRDPDEAEARATLGLAGQATRLNAWAWAWSGLAFAVLNGFIESWGFAAVVAATIWLGGETTCALGYLLYERALRPVTALALSARPATAGGTLAVRTRLAMAWLLGTGVPLVGLLAIGFAGTLGISHHHPKYLAGATLFVAAVACATGFLATTLAARAIAEPLADVRHGLERIERGELDVHLRVDDGSEIGRLQTGFNRMTDGLREREHLRELFGRHVGEEVAQRALRVGVSLGGEEREVAALFIDLVGSTGLALNLPPMEVVAVLNRFFRVVIDVVEAGGGFVNKFEGDAALCLFGAPVSRPDSAGDALRAASELAARLTRELPEVDFGIGVSAGPAVAGNVGAERRLEYTVIGDPVNEAARLAELAKQRPERVLASGSALDRADAEAAAAWRGTEAAVLRGRTTPTRLAHPAP